ncbi:MAG: enterochelin esterase, partial [Sphingomonadales bacterium]
MRGFVLALAPLLLLAAAPASDPVAVPVTLGTGLGEHQSGRLLVFAKKIEPGAKPGDVDIDVFAPDSVIVAARDVPNLVIGATALVD